MRMEIQIEKGLLAEALKKAQAVADKRSDVGLDHVLLKADDGKASLTTFDHVVGLKTVLPAEVVQGGEVLLDAQRLYEIVRSLSGTVVVLAEDNGRVRISCGSAVFRLRGLDPDSFPELPVEASWQRLAHMEAERLSELISRVHFSASTDETRPNLQGVYLHEHEGAVRAVATDGHRFTMADATLDAPAVYERGLILPTKGCNALLTILGGYSGQVCTLHVGSAVAFCELGGETVYFRLIDGQFPDYKQVIPEDNIVCLSLHRETLLAAIKRVSALYKGSSAASAPRVELCLSDGKLQLFSENPDIGDGLDTLPVEYVGKELAVGFNAKYLVELLKSIDTDDVGVELDIDECAPVVFRAAGDIEHMGIVMPMRG